ncbi:ribonuclease H-like domain-containing protein [Tanacetum coccineum]|uniref:Ribonuclease H-like domain-containing protein n=1 Tax=Tanacetum coccineum TaxID=301880 RepID=A0ABQ5BJ84_9ASTR
MTRQVLLRCDSMRDLYPIKDPFPIPRALLFSQHTWHQCLGHPGGDVLRRIVSNNVISCNKEKPPVLCHACQLGKHVRLLFVNQYSQFVWVYPLLNKSDVLSKFVLFRTYVRTQFKCEIRSFHCGHDIPTKHGMDTAYLLLYVDDIVLTTSSRALLQQIITSLHKEFAMTGLGSLNYFLGIAVTRYSSRIFLSQKKYTVEILERAHMVNCNPSQTLVGTESKLGIDGDPTLYQSLVGSLHYLTFTRPDISYAVQQVCLHMHDPREPYFSALKRILRYVHGTMDYGLQLFSSSAIDLVAYSDADWAGCPTTQRSTVGCPTSLHKELCVKL